MSCWGQRMNCCGLRMSCWGGCSCITGGGDGYDKGAPNQKQYGSQSQFRN